MGQMLHVYFGMLNNQEYWYTSRKRMKVAERHKSFLGLNEIKDHGNKHEYSNKIFNNCEKN